MNRPRSILRNQLLFHAWFVITALALGLAGCGGESSGNGNGGVKMATPILVTDGDSITVGYGTATSYPGIITPNGGPWAIYDTAIPGESLATMVANAATFVDP